MRGLVLLLSICLVSGTASCDSVDIFGRTDVEIFGTVKTAQGAPVEGVQVSRFLRVPDTTDSEGYYHLSPSSVKASECGGVSIRLYKDPHEKWVSVGKCGKRRVDVSDWPEGN